MASYWQKYGLTADPFVDEGLAVEAFFPSRWQQQLDLLCHLSRTSNMILLVTGISGIGKSTFMEMLFDKIESKTGVCKVHGSQGVTPDVLQELVIRHIGMPAGGTPDSNFQQRFLLQTERMHQAQDEFYLVIDNAHKLPKSSLALLLDLAEWQSGEAHPLHLVLFGGPQLDAMMAEITAQHLGEAATHTIRIEPFSVEMTHDYILHRMNQAGFEGDLPLSELQINQIHQASSGIPAKINLAARQVLLDSDMKNVKRKPVKTAKPGVPKRETEKLKKASGIFSLSGIWMIGLFSLVAIVLFILFRVKATEPAQEQQNVPQQAESSLIKPESAALLQPSVDNKQEQVEGMSGEEGSSNSTVQEPPQVAESQNVAPSGATGTLQNEQSYPDSSVPTYSSSSVEQQDYVGSSNALDEQSAPADSSVNDTPPTVVSHDEPIWVPLNTRKTSAVNQETQVASSLAPTVQTAPITQNESAQTTSTTPPIETQTTPSPVKTTPQTKPTATITPKPVAKPVPAKALKSVNTLLLTADEQSLMKIKPSRFTLQIAGATDYARLKVFVKEMGLSGQVYFFRTTNAGKPWYVAIYGNYADQESAKRSIKDLPVDLLMKQKVWPRSFGSVQQALQKVK
ncbi:MAG: AAA family ATPase [Legionellales bacterium]|nr:AAA family ATPase [Legionellales bacterium]